MREEFGADGTIDFGEVGGEGDAGSYYIEDDVLLLRCGHSVVRNDGQKGIKVQFEWCRRSSDEGIEVDVSSRGFV